MKTIVFCTCLFISLLLPAQMKNNVDAVSGATESCKEITCYNANIWNVIKNRRSVRKFQSKQVPQEDITRILNAARMAPTAGNQQPWKFLVVQDSIKIKQMRDACIKQALKNYSPERGPLEDYTKNVNQTFSNYCSAPVYIIILTNNNSKYPDYNHWDGPIAAGYLMLAARALNYGTVFITDAISEKVTKEVFNIPDNYTRVCITPLGIPEEWPKSPAKKNLSEFIINEKF